MMSQNQHWFALLIQLIKNKNPKSLINYNNVITNKFHKKILLKINREQKIWVNKEDFKKIKLKNKN